MDSIADIGVGGIFVLLVLKETLAFVKSRHSSSTSPDTVEEQVRSALDSRKTVDLVEHLDRVLDKQSQVQERMLDKLGRIAASQDEIKQALNRAQTGGH